MPVAAAGPEGLAKPAVTHEPRPTPTPEATSGVRAVRAQAVRVWAKTSPAKAVSDDW